MPPMNDSPLGARVAVRQSNPKKVGSKSFVRFEAYKKATTVGEYLSLGGTRADLSYDESRGFLSIDATGVPPDVVEDDDNEEELADSIPWNDSEYVDDMCDACGLPTITKDGFPARRTLVCDACDCENHIRCSGHRFVPKTSWSCRVCQEAQNRGELGRKARKPHPRNFQLSTRCINCGLPGTIENPLFICHVDHCTGIFHIGCVEDEEKFDGGDLDDLRDSLKCPRCRTKRTPPKETVHWKLEPSGHDPIEQARAYSVALSHAHSLSSELAGACLKANFVLPTCSERQQDFCREDRVKYEAEEDYYEDDGIDDADEEEYLELSGGWWQKLDKATGNFYYVHERDGRTQWVSCFSPYKFLR